jgi:sulfofructose kinase
MVEVLCIGHASYDLSVFLPAFPAENSKGETDQLLQSGGGPAANAAYLLSAWGIRCGFAGLLGDDAYGRQITAEFKAVGTNVSLIEIPPLYETPVSLILVNLKNGSRTLVNRKGRQASLRISKPALTKMAPRFLLFDGHEPNASLSALESFPHAVSVLDAGSLRGGTRVLAGKVDYLVASEKFACQDCKLTSLKTAQDWRDCIKSLRERYGNKVVVTLGELGAIADDGGGHCRVRAFKAEPVDTTAAGDIFHGAFVYGLIKGMSFQEILRFASVAAGLSVLRRGGRTSVPNLRQVQRAQSYAN